MRLYKSINDIELISLIRLGNHSAFAELYHRYWQSLFNHAYKRLNNKDISQDVVQNIFTDLWERKENIQIENIPAYLHGAIRFQVLKQAVAAPDQVAITDLFETEIIFAGQADDTLRSEEIQALLRLWLQALPEKRREIFILHYFQGKSTEEIADMKQISQKTVQNQLNTAATAIKSQFDKLLVLQIVSSMMPF